MAVPKKKTSKSKNRMRQSNKALDSANVISVNNDLQLSHRISIKDGIYKGRVYKKVKKEKISQE